MNLIFSNSPAETLNRETMMAKSVPQPSLIGKRWQKITVNGQSASAPKDNGSRPGKLSMEGAMAFGGIV